MNLATKVVNLVCALLEWWRMWGFVRLCHAIFIERHITCSAEILHPATRRLMAAYKNSQCGYNYLLTHATRSDLPDGRVETISDPGMENIGVLSKCLLQSERMSRFTFPDFNSLHDRDLSIYTERLVPDNKKRRAPDFSDGRITELEGVKQETADQEKEDVGNSAPSKEDDDGDDNEGDCHTTNEHDNSIEQDKRKSSKEDDRNSETFVAVIAQSILSVPTKRMTLSSIYSFIARNYPHFDKEKGPGWRNSVRHNLSSNDCFVKASRAENGKGHYWMIHPKDLPEFAKGNFRRRRKPRRPKCSHPFMFRENQFLYHSFTPAFSAFPYTPHLRTTANDLRSSGVTAPLPFASAAERTLSPTFSPRFAGLLPGFEDARALRPLSPSTFSCPVSSLRLAETASSRDYLAGTNLANFAASFHYPCACQR